MGGLPSNLEHFQLYLKVPDKIIQKFVTDYSNPAVGVCVYIYYYIEFKKKNHISLSKIAYFRQSDFDRHAIVQNLSKLNTLSKVNITVLTEKGFCFLTIISVVLNKFEMQKKK